MKSLAVPPVAIALLPFLVAAQFPPLPPEPTSPSCMINGKGCPVPTGWDTDWSLINSTALMDASAYGFNTSKRWGLVTLDWQSGYKKWLRPDPHDITVHPPFPETKITILCSLYAQK